MTSTQERPAEAGSIVRWARTPIGLGVLVLVAIVLAFGLGASWSRSTAESGTWHTGQGQIGIREVSIASDGWTYGISGTVPLWVDADGTWHDDSWPTCLQPVGGHVTVRFQARSVTVEGQSWRQIIAVDCRGEG